MRRSPAPIRSSWHATPSRASSNRRAASLDAQASLLRRRAAEGQPLLKPSAAASDTDPAEAAAWVDFALAMINRNEFVYVP